MGLVKRTCVMDSEGNGLLDTITKLWCAVLKDIHTGEVFKFHIEQGDSWWKNLFEFMDSCDVVCGHNCIQFDFPAFKKLFGYEYKGRVVDTLHISRLHAPDRRLPPNCPSTYQDEDGTKHRVGPHSVKAWGYRVGRGKVEHEDWSKFSMEMLHRCTEDVEIQTLIWIELQREAEGWNWEPAYALTNRLFYILGQQEDYGWLMDRPQMDKSISMLSTIIYKIDEVLAPTLPPVLVVEESKVKGEYKHFSSPFKRNGDYCKRAVDWIESAGFDVTTRPIKGPFSRINFRPVNLGSNAEVKQMLLDAGWEPKEWNTSKKTGERTSPKMNQNDPFKGVEGRHGNLLVRRVICRHRRSQIEGWISNLRPDGRLSGRVTGLAHTGRAKHAVIVNVPGGDAYFGRQMRKCFTSKPGYVIVGTDSAGCQNRMLAARVGDPAFTATLIEGNKELKTDIHNVNARAITQALAEEFPHLGLEVDRHASKSLNYGTLFGASDAKIGKMLGHGPDVGACVKRAIFGVAPGFQKLVDDLKAEWERTATMKRNKFGKYSLANGKIEGLDGRPITIESPHMILVYMLQSDEAIMMAAAYCYLYKWAEARGWKHGREWGYCVWMHKSLCPCTAMYIE